MRTFSERIVYDGPEVQVSEVDVGLSNGERIWREVVHLFRSASVAVIDEQERVLLLWRYRFAQDRWGWELPGGLVDEGEESQAAAVRELEDLTGYRPGQLAHLVSFQPAPDSADGEHSIFVCREAELVGEAVSGEGVARSERVPFASIPALIAAGEIWASATLIGLLHVLAHER